MSLILATQKIGYQEGLSEKVSHGNADKKVMSAGHEVMGSMPGAGNVLFAVPDCHL